MKAAGIENVYGKTLGKTRTTFNTGKACMKALEKLGGIKAPSRLLEFYLPQ